MVMVDTQVVKGGRAGRDFHESHAKYRLRGAKRVVAVEVLGLRVGARVVGARRHEVGAARDLLDELLPRHPGVSAMLGDRAAWSDSGGGYSNLFREPSYQSNASISDPGGTRGVPDVAFDANVVKAVEVTNRSSLVATKT